MSDTTGIWALANKPSVALQDPLAQNQLLALTQGLQVRNAGMQQDLADRGTLRDLAGGLTSRDPSALGTAASLGALGTGSINALSGLDHNVAADKLALATFDRAQFRLPGQPSMSGLGAGGTGGVSGASGAPSANGTVPPIPSVSSDAALSSITDPQARALVARAAGSQGLPPEAIPFWVASLHNESGGSPRLNLPNGAAGEIGPGQIMPATGAGLGYTPAQLQDPATNLEASAKYFGQQWKASNGDPMGALRGYNGGNPGNMKAQGYATAALGRMNGWGGGSPVAGPAPAAASSPAQFASANGTTGMPATATDAGGPAPAAAPDPLQAALARMRANQVGGVQPGATPQPGGSLGPLLTAAPPATAPTNDLARLAGIVPASVRRLPADEQFPATAAAGDDVTNIDRPEYAQSLPRGTRYSVANGPVQERAGGAWTPTSDQPPAAAGNPLHALMLAATSPAASVLAPLVSANGQAPSGAGQSGLLPPTQQSAPAAALSAPVAPTPAAAQPQAGGGGLMAASPQQPGAFGGGSGQPSTPPPQTQGGAQPGGLPPGFDFFRDGLGQYQTHGLQPGYAMAGKPDGRGGIISQPFPIPNMQELTFEKAGNTMFGMDKRTGQVVSQTAIPDTRRPVKAESSDGTVLMDASGNKIGFIPKGNRDIDVQIYKEDREQAQQMAEAGMQAQAQQVRLLEARALLPQLSNTGADGENRAKWANFAETYMSPGFAAAFKSKLNLPDAVPAQEFAKLMTQNAGQQERGVMGARGGVQAMQLFLGANPGLGMRPEANRDLLNAMLVASQADQDYAAGHIAFVNQNGEALRQGGAYKPVSNFNQQWIAQRNPQVYAATMGAMNGQPFEVWSKNLRPEEMGRVGQIIGRIDPSTTIFGPRNQVLHVPAPQPQGAQ